MATSRDHRTDEAPVGAPLPSTQRSLAFALLRAREKVMTPIRAMLVEAGITEQQWRVLRVLDEFGPLEASKLAELACLLLPSQSRIVQTLVDKGLVTRVSARDDRRKQIVAITAAGRQTIAANLERAMILAGDLERLLGKAGLARLLDQLKVLDRL